MGGVYLEYSRGSQWCEQYVINRCQHQILQLCPQCSGQNNSDRKTGTGSAEEAAACVSSNLVQVGRVVVN